MMGNQRQMLRDNIEKELKSQLEAAKDVLGQLNKNLEINKQNSFNAKEEIRVTSDMIKDILIKRKKELIKEVENLHHAQAKPLQDAVKSTYITMGRLQNMLANLDSFDQSQLVSLQIPAVDTSCTLNEPAQIRAVLECDKIKDELKEWGSITDEFQFCMLNDAPDNLRPGSCSSPNETPLVDNKENQKILQSSVLPAMNAYYETACAMNNYWGIENWLSRSAKKTSISCESKDDSVGNMDQDMEFVVLQENDSASNQMDQESSIVCIEKETVPAENKDLSMWLKPKKSKSSLQQQSLEDNNDKTPVTITQTENILKSLSLDNNDRRKMSTSSNLNKRRLDFPCLHMGSENWIRKRKPRSLASGCSNKSVNDKLQLLPPTYALPPPFWLNNSFKKRF